MQAQGFASNAACGQSCDAIESQTVFLCGKVCGEPVSRCNVILGRTIAAVPRIVAGSIGIRPLGPVTPRGNKKKKTVRNDPQTSFRLIRQVLRHNPPSARAGRFP